MDMIEKYVKLVGQNLPAAMSEDIQKEIRSVIEDMLEDESRSAGRPADENMVAGVLQRLGRPEKVAASYLPPRYLIGPDLFPHFITTLKIVLTVATILAMVGLGFGLVLKAGSAATLGETLLQVIGGLVQVIFQAAAVVVVVFAVLQWAGTQLKTGEKPWDPRAMKVEEDPQRINVAERITEIIFTILLLVILNFYPEWVGISNFNGVWVHVQVLTDAFFAYLPLINLIFGLDILRNILLLAYGRWTTPLRWYSAAVSVATIVVAALMLTGPVLAAVSPDALNRLGLGALDAATQALAARGANLLVRMVIAIVLVVELVELGQNLYRLLLKSRLPALGGAAG